MYTYLQIVGHSYEALPTVSGDSPIANERLLAFPPPLLHHLTQQPLQLSGGGGLQLGVGEPHMNILEGVRVSL